MHETLLTREIFSTLDYAYNRQTCVLIQGRTGRGKTVAVRAWAASIKDAYYIDCPSDGGIPTIASAIAKVSGSPSVSGLDVHLASRRTILVLDECARLIPSRSKRARALEYLRRLHDQSNVALAFVATDFFMRECTMGGLGEYLEQFIGRFRDKLIIPDFVSREEVIDILSAYITPDDPITDFAFKVANAPGQGGARRLWWLVEDASAIARRTAHKIDLPFLKATLTDYEGRDRLPKSPANTSKGK